MLAHGGDGPPDGSPPVRHLDAAQQPPTSSPAAAAGGQADTALDAGRRAGRGGLAVAAAKIYFILVGLVQQVALKRVLGLEGYGALSSALGAASIVYNPIVAASLQGVSHTVATAPESSRPQALRGALRVHAVASLAVGLAFLIFAPGLGELTGAPHIVGTLRVLSAVLVVYGLYAPLVGALNGQTRFLSQAGLDALAATLRTIGLIGGAFLLARAQLPALGGVEGAAVGFALSSLLVLLVALAHVGIGRAGGSGRALTAYLRYIGPILIGQVLLNLLFQADQLLLRRFSADAAASAGLDPTAADPLVGAYRATQLFCFLPYQLVTTVSIVLFPMLARAHHGGDRAAVARYVRQGMRLSLIAAGALVSVTHALAGPLLTLVFGSEVALLAAAPMQLLALGLGSLALLGVLTAVLNSLQLQRQSLIVTGLACILVAALCFGRVQGQPFGPDLLWHTAGATSVALVAATLVAALLVYRSAGTVIALSSVLRVLAALAVAAASARLWPPPSLLLTPALSALLALTYVLALVLLRELTGADWRALRDLLRRRRSAHSAAT
jgi:stage V sporulation protein B